jgi:DNA-binding IclR family transcriptional regulator
MRAEMILHLVDRVQRGFLERPGLRVTLQQAQERWHLDELTARQILDAMVEAHLLSYSRRRGIYSLDVGRQGLLRNLNLGRLDC